MEEQGAYDEYRPLLEMSADDREKIKKAAKLTRRTSNKFIEKSALDCADRIIEHHEEHGVNAGETGVFNS